MPEIKVKEISYDAPVVLMVIVNVLSIIFDVFLQLANFGNRLPIVQAFYPGLSLTFGGIAIALFEAVIYGIIDGVLIALIYNKIIAKRFPLRLKH